MPANDHEARDLVLSLGLTHCLANGRPTICMPNETMNEPSSLSSGRVFGCRIVEMCIWIGSDVVDRILQCGPGKAKGNRSSKWNPKTLERSKTGKPSLTCYSFFTVV